MVSNKRYDIEALRILAMLCIVMGHCFAIYGVWVTDLNLENASESSIYHAINPLLIYYALPIFTSISGYLLGYKSIFSSPSFDYFSFIRKKVKRLYIPALFFSIVYALLFHKETFSDISLLAKLLIQGQGHLWFIYMLFTLYILSYPAYLLCHKINRRFYFFILFIVCIVSCFYPLGTSLFTVFFYQIFFFSGILIGEKQKQSKVKNVNSFVSVQLLIRGISYIVVFFLLSLIKESSYMTKLTEQYASFHYFQHWFFRFIIGLLSIIITFSLMPLALHLNKAFSKIASMSYNIYITHQFILIGLLAIANPQLLALHEHTPWLFPFLLFLIVFVMSYLISLCFTKLPVLNKL